MITPKPHFLPITLNLHPGKSGQMISAQMRYVNGKLTEWNGAKKKIFYEAFEGLFTPNDNTRYVIKFKNFKDKYVFVPKIFSDKKQIEIFANELKMFFGPTEIISVEEKLGKRELLKARYNQFIKAQAAKKRIWGVGR